MIQKSYESSCYGKLYLIPTPIGNLDDITIRAQNTLKFVDIVYAEDTRETLSLLKYYNINKPVKSCHKFTEMKHKDKIISTLKDGKNIGYVTDRGTPLISDPGNVIVDEVIKANLDVIALPGPNALLPALNMSGLSNEKFLFYGFLSSKTSIAKKELQKLKNFEHTIIIYESPHRILNTLKIILEVLGDRKISIAREISKIHEEIIRDNLSKIIEKINSIKGELVIIIEGNNNKEIDKTDYVDKVKELVKKGYTKRDAIKEISEIYNISKNKLYEECKE